MTECDNAKTPDFARFEKLIAGKEVIRITAAHSGAQCHDKLRGIEKDTENVELEVVGGVVDTPSIILTHLEGRFGIEKLHESMGHHFGVSTAKGDAILL